MAKSQIDLKDLKRTGRLEETHALDREMARLKLAQSEIGELHKRHKKLLNRAAEEDRMVEVYDERVREHLGSGFKIEIPPLPKITHSKASDEEAVIVISDTHIGKIVEPSQTLGFGNYNLKVFFDRLHFAEQTATSLLREKVANPISRIHVLILGDIIEGMLGHASEIPMRELVADQVLVASTALYQFVARLARLAPVTVRGLGGNHSRWPTMKRTPTENTYSNFDFIVLGQMEALFRQAGPKNVTMILEENPFQVFDIQGWRFKIGHGDHLKGGDKALGVPAHAIGREVNATTQRYNARGQKAPDYYIVGDKHRHMSVQTATGRYMVNGAWFTDCPYAMSANFTPGKPFQMLFGIHKKFGKTWSYDIALDLAKPVELQYDLPPRLREKVLNS